MVKLGLALSWRQRHLLQHSMLFALTTNAFEKALGRWATPIPCWEEPPVLAGSVPMGKIRLRRQRGLVSY